MFTEPVSEEWIIFRNSNMFLSEIKKNPPFSFQYCRRQVSRLIYGSTQQLGQNSYPYAKGVKIAACSGY